MILFYSDYCNHCSMLLEHIKRYDKDKSIKLVSVDVLRSRNMKLDSKIHAVPALMLMPSKEVLFGKAVFDHLLLPPRGVLCGGQSTRNDKNTKKENALEAPDGTIAKPTLDISSNGEPVAFSLNSVLSDNFSNINDSIDTIIDKNYNWDTIDSSSGIVAYQPSITDINASQTGATRNIPKEPSHMLNNKEEKKASLPSLEELQKQRDSEVFFK